jgi:hypothetical protein
MMLLWKSLQCFDLARPGRRGVVPVHPHPKKRMSVLILQLNIAPINLEK